MSLGVMADNLSPTKANFYFKIIKLGLLWRGGPHKVMKIQDHSYVIDYLRRRKETLVLLLVPTRPPTPAPKPLDPFTLSLSWKLEPHRKTVDGIRGGSHVARTHWL